MDFNLLDKLSRAHLISNLKLLKDSIYPPMALGIIAALTPPHWEVEILDENFTEFEYKDVDLVGFTSLTATVNRCYELATEYKKNKICLSYHSGIAYIQQFFPLWSKGKKKRAGRKGFTVTGIDITLLKYQHWSGNGTYPVCLFKNTRPLAGRPRNCRNIFP